MCVCVYPVILQTVLEVERHYKLFTLSVSIEDWDKAKVVNIRKCIGWLAGAWLLASYNTSTSSENVFIARFALRRMYFWHGFSSFKSSMLVRRLNASCYSTMKVWCITGISYSTTGALKFNWIRHRHSNICPVKWTSVQARRFSRYHMRFTRHSLYNTTIDLAVISPKRRL